MAVKADDRVRSCILPNIYIPGQPTLSQSITEVSLEEPPVIDLGPKSDEGSSIDAVESVKEG